jgi:eukaryotic-like serine/threonine-protein kinase
MSEQTEETGEAPGPGRALPDRIGGYRIVRELGRGGMGVVYEAEQDNPRRTVALKVVTQGVMSREALARFDLEAHVLGRLQHPGIAQIFEAGKFERDGESYPFFAMELIRGEPIVAYAEKRGLAARARLELIAKVCDAVHHAHTRGVVHRDLKPGNILVDEQGQPKVLDFGVARATDSDILTTTLRTDIGQLVGTVPYMSPEQASGDPNSIDTRSDVYSLGVVAYQLLSGRMPYDIERAAVHEAVRIVIEEDPLPLSTIVRALRGDVETIIGKALEKEVTRRYASAEAFASDIRAYLSNREISARAPSAWYRLQKFARRNKATVTFLALILLALVGGLVGTTKGYLAAKRNAEESQRNEKLAREETVRANQTATFFKQILGGVNPEVAQGRDTSLLKELLDQTATRIEKELAGQPAVEVEIREMLGQTYGAISDFPDSLDQYQTAAKISQTAFGPEDERTLQDAQSVGTTLHLLGRSAEAEKQLTSLSEISRRVLGEDHGLTDKIRCELGVVYLQTNRVDEAAPLFERSLAYRRKHYGDDAEPTLVAENCLGLARLQQNRFEEGEKILKDALERRQRVNGEKHPETIKAKTNLGGVYESVGRYADAEPLFRQALDANLAILGPDHVVTINSQMNLAGLFRYLGHVEDSEKMFREALEASRRVSGVDHPETLAVETQLGNLLRLSKRPEEALPLHQHILDVRTRTLGPDDPEALKAAVNVASDLAGTGRHDESLKLRTMLLEKMPRVLGEKNASTLVLMNDLAVEYLSLKRYDEAEPLVRRALAARREVLGPKHMETLQSVYTLGALLFDRKKDAEAIPVLAEFLAGWTAIYGDENQYSIGSANKILECAEATDRLADAEPALRALLEYHRRRAKPDAAAIARTLAILGQSLAAKGDLDAAEAMLVDAYDKLGESEAARRAKVAAALAALYEKRGDAAKAAEWSQRAPK